MRTIRRGVFETNSSSMHSLVIKNETKVPSFRSKYFAGVREALKELPDGQLEFTVPCPKSLSDYGTTRIDTFVGKLGYLLQACFDCWMSKNHAKEWGFFDAQADVVKDKWFKDFRASYACKNLEQAAAFTLDKAGFRPRDKYMWVTILYDKKLVTEQCIDFDIGRPYDELTYLKSLFDILGDPTIKIEVSAQ